MNKLKIKKKIFSRIQSVLINYRLIQPALNKGFESKWSELKFKKKMHSHVNLVQGSPGHPVVKHNLETI